MARVLVAVIGAGIVVGRGGVGWIHDVASRLSASANMDIGVGVHARITSRVRSAPRSENRIRLAGALLDHDRAWSRSARDRWTASLTFVGTPDRLGDRRRVIRDGSRNLLVRAASIHGWPQRVVAVSPRRMEPADSAVRAARAQWRAHGRASAGR